MRKECAPLPTPLLTPFSSQVIETKLRVETGCKLTPKWFTDKKTGKKDFSGWALRYNCGNARRLAELLWRHAGFKAELLFYIAFGEQKFTPARAPKAYGDYTPELVATCKELKKTWSNRA